MYAAAALCGLWERDTARGKGDFCEKCCKKEGEGRQNFCGAKVCGKDAAQWAARPEVCRAMRAGNGGAGRPKAKKEAVCRRQTAEKSEKYAEKTKNA